MSDVSEIRFSSIEPRTPSAPTTPNGHHDGFNGYALPDEDDNVFHDSKVSDQNFTSPYPDTHASTDTIVPPPPTPGTAPALNTAPKGSWLHKPLRCRYLILLAVGVALFIGLAIATAVVIIFANTDSSSPKSSSQTSNRTSTTDTPNTEIQYQGYMYLSEPWEGNNSALQSAMAHDFRIAMEDTPIYHSYLSASVISVSKDNRRVSFNVNFNQTLLKELDSEENVAGRIQSIMRSRVVSSQGSMKLNVDPESIVILGDIPSSMSNPVITTQPSSFPSSPSSLSSPSAPSTEAAAQCHPLTHNNPCHSFGQTFHLPNTLNHASEDLAITEFARLATPVMSTACSDSTMLYFCTLLFPPCDEEGVPMPPCDSLCNVVKSDCGNKYPLGVESCDMLPQDHCTPPQVAPTTPEPATMPNTTPEVSTSSSVITAGATTNTQEPPPSTEPSTAASTTAESSPKTAETSSPTNPNPTQTSPTATPNTGPINETTYECVPFDFEPCNSIGMTERISPNPFFHQITLDEMIHTFYQFSNNSLQQGCTQGLTFLCSYFFTQCDKVEDPQPLEPCKETCEDAMEQCGSYYPYFLDCEYFFNMSVIPCVKPPVKPTEPPTTQEPPEQCVEQPLKICTDEGFTNISLSDNWSSSLSKMIHEFQTFAVPIITSNCSPYSTFFYCSIYFPPCGTTDGIQSACRKYCHEVMNNCEVPVPLDCDSLFNDSSSCLHPQTKPQTTEKPQVTSEAPSLPSTAIPEKCIPLQPSLCSHFGYQYTTFPNFWGYNSMEDAIKTYYGYAEESVSSGCSPNVLFYVCSVLFPYCEADRKFKQPCTRYCEEVNANCPNLFKQKCDILSDPNEETCLAPPPVQGCLPSEFKCYGLNKCVPLSTKCNQNNDCGDWSDEQDCQCNPEFQVQCALGLCIPSYFRCDGINQCPDYSDESGCENACPMGQYKCEEFQNSSLCIMPEWLCDGQLDCPEGDDEFYCHACLSTEFMCNDKACIPYTQFCDGVFQCKDHSDEIRCIYKTSPLDPFYIEAGEGVVSVCADSFDDEAGQLTCEKMGQKSLAYWNKVPSDGFSKSLKLNPTGRSNSVVGPGDIVGRSECPDDKVVAIACNDNECGHKSLNIPLNVIGGGDAVAGSWPWLVSLKDYNNHVCGGAIIGPHHILTAAHCVDKYVTFDHLLVLAGSNQWTKTGHHGREYYVRRVVMHPEYYRLEGHDVALIELKKPIVYNDYIKPLCLPKKSNVFTRANRCFIAGWGHTTGKGGQPSESLQETKITLWDTQKCNSSFMWNGRLLAKDMCAGYFNGLIAACSGDSGSPVMCQDTTDTWRSVGIASYVYKSCSVPTKPMVFTPTQPYLDWIHNNTECIFRCDNGTCLFDKKMLCNTVDDCEDKTDETKFCHVTPNCTFSDEFLCGYKSKWLMRTHSGSPNRFPLFDHTSGGYPGFYLAGYGVAVDLHAPRVELMTPHCFRFFIHMRGEIRSGMSISIYKLEDKKWTYPWTVKKEAGAPDIWLMGYFDLSPGTYNILVRPHEGRKFAIDDISVLPGKCESMTCLPGEFMCRTYGDVNCLPEAMRCNLVMDCDDASDEEDCHERSYSCSFDNGIVCGLEQDTLDSKIAEWQFVNSSKTIDDLRDHSTDGTQFGPVLEISTLYMIDTDQVNMAFHVLLSEQSYCLKFYYVSTSPASLMVTMPVEEVESEKVFEFSNRRTLSWMPAQATLPSASYYREVKMTFTVKGTDIRPDTMDQVLIIDDISISEGACPALECPGDSLKCEDENFCLPRDQVCDRIVNCAKRTDEINCECTDMEYKCPTGPCIPKLKTCDLNLDCPDGSDEGSICDDKRTISCDFRDKFVCGYTVDTSSSTYHWEHTTGPMGGQLTGPQSGHTLPGNQDTHGYYFGASSRDPGITTNLQSPFFQSNGSGLVFFYHATHLFNPEESAGKLTVILTNANSGKTEELWSTVPSAENTWKMKCITLPEGKLSISFRARKGTSEQMADFGIDNVKYLNTSCDSYLKDVHITNGGNGDTDGDNNSECAANYKACRSGLCVQEDFFCDGYADCVDDSDEEDCP